MKLTENYVPEHMETPNEHISNKEITDNVCVIDGMAIVQAIKKGPEI